MRIPALTVRLRTEASGPVAASVAWSRYAEPARWPSWSPQLSRVEYTPTRLTPGTGGRVVGPGGLWAGFWIEDVDEGARTWVWTVRRGPVTLALEHGVEPAGPGGTGSRTWLAIRGPGPVVLPYLPVARIALGRLVSMPEA